ncbi:hypothetical protein C8F01DRAFT_1091823 [Mycena amicta]|nr:hypothetical protein C8F01DRAFT_1091823 [Mycena amicta]
MDDARLCSSSLLSFPLLTGCRQLAGHRHPLLGRDVLHGRHATRGVGQDHDDGRGVGVGVHLHILKGRGRRRLRREGGVEGFSRCRRIELLDVEQSVRKNDAVKRGRGWRETRRLVNAGIPNIDHREHVESQIILEQAKDELRRDHGLVFQMRVLRREPKQMQEGLLEETPEAVQHEHNNTSPGQRGQEPERGKLGEDKSVRRIYDKNLRRTRWLKRSFNSAQSDLP